MAGWVNDSCRGFTGNTKNVPRRVTFHSYESFDSCLVTTRLEAANWHVMTCASVPGSQLLRGVWRC